MLAGMAFVAGAIALVGPAPVAAQVYTPSAYREDPGTALSRHLRTLAESPRNLAALTGAAKAALDLGDAQSAATFYARAEEVAPRDGRVKAGLGAAFIEMEQPESALKFFEDARILGVPEAEFAADRGLAYDLVGNTVQAQRDYQLAMRVRDDDEVRRRMALSLGISGDRTRALELIEPQLRRQDRAAWRVRAFVLALTGDPAGATEAVRVMMPAQAAQMQPFLARLPLLGPADRAAAVHYGRFPQSALQMAEAPPRQYASAAPATPAVTTPSNSRPTAQQRRSTAQAPASRQRTSRPSSSDSSWTDERDMLRGGGATKRRTVTRANPPQPVQTTTVARAPVTAPVAAPAPTPPPVAGSTYGPSVQLADASSAMTSATTVPQYSSTPVAPIPAAPTEVQPPIASADIPQSSLTGSNPLPSPADPVEPAPTTVPAPSTSASALADIAAAVRALPESPEETAATQPRPEPKKPAAQPRAETKKAEPAKKAAEAKAGPRYWVQLASAPEAATAGEYKRIKAKAPKLLGETTGWKASYRSTYRVLVGPFKDQKEAQALVNALAKADIDAVPWTSEAGQEIVKLAAK